MKTSGRSSAGIKQTRQQLMALNEDSCVFLKDAGVMKRDFPAQNSPSRRPRLGFPFNRSSLWMALDAVSPDLGLCLLFPCCCPSRSHTCSAAVKRADVLGVREHSSVSLCTALFPDTVQNTSGLGSPFSGLSDSTRELQSMNAQSLSLL